MVRFYDSERGAVALITTIIISLLLAILTTGLVATMSSELRQQDDNEQANLAYYAAQSGVEDAVNKIRASLPNITEQKVCGGFHDLVNPPTGQVGWTCQLIIASGQPTGTLSQPDQSVQVNPGDTAQDYNKVVVSWDTAALVKGGAPSPAAYAGGVWTYPAPLEISIVEYKKGGFNITTDPPVLKNVLFWPSDLPGPDANFITLGNSPDGQNPVFTKCAPNASGYNCTASITGLTLGEAYLFRIRSRFVGTSYKMVFYNGGTAVDVPDGSALIDVTAKSGDAYRRVIYQVPYKAGAAQGLDFVVYSDTDVCKDFSYINTTLVNGSSCP